MNRKKEIVVLDELLSNVCSERLKDHIDNVYVEESKDNQNCIGEISHDDLRLYEVSLSKKGVKIERVQFGRYLTVALAAALLIAVGVWLL